MQIFHLIPLLALLAPALAVPNPDMHDRAVTTSTSTAKTSTTTVKPSTSTSSVKTSTSTAKTSTSSAKASSTSAVKTSSSSSSSAAKSTSTSISKASTSSAAKSSSSAVSIAKASSSAAKSSTSSAAKSSTSSAAKSSTSSAAASTSTSTTAADQTEFLNLHNNFRKEYSANALTWNSTLATYAQNTANTCVFKHTNGPYGENLAAGVGGGYDIAHGFNDWAVEVSYYNASDPKPSHYTQVVWKSTKQVGCAVSSCADGTIFTGYGQNSLYIVCEYYPRGNIVNAGYFAANVGSHV